MDDLKDVFSFDNDPELYACEVSAVDEGTMTINALMDDERIIEGVKLRSVINDEAVGIVAIPEVGSQIVIAKVEGVEDYVVIKTSELSKIVIDISGSLKANIPTIELKGKSLKMEVEKVELKISELKVDADKTTFNGGKNLGVPKVAEIAKQLNLIESDISTLKAAAAGWVPAGTVADGGTWKTAISPWAAKPLAQSMASTMENKDITH